jgi:hypothetical protein
VADFDFDHWAELARRDPPAYFRARQRVVSRFIDNHPPAQAQRLREVQARIDCLRAMSAGPVQATRQLAALLEEHVEALHVAMGRLLTLSEGFGRGPGSPGAS